MSAAKQSSANSLSVFISYAQGDSFWRTKLEEQLAALQRQGLIASWSSAKVRPGKVRASVIAEQLEAAHIILLLVSPGFIASDQCYSDEMQRAVERHKAGEARVIPVLLTPTAGWEETPFGMLQPLPSGGKFIKEWRTSDLALYNVGLGVRAVVEELLNKGNKLPASFRNMQWKPPPTSPNAILQRSDLVHELYTQLIQPGISALVLNGMGGIGKSTLAALVYKYAERQREEGRGPFMGKALWLKISPASTIVDLIGTLRAALGEAPLDYRNFSAENMAFELFKTLDTHPQPCLIVLDQFEEWFDPQTGRALAERPGVGEWLDLLNSQPCASRVLLTSRFSLQGTRPYPFACLQEFSLRALNEGEGVTLLRLWDIHEKDPELRLAVQRCQGHPYALCLLSGLLQNDPGIHISTLFNDREYAIQRTQAMAQKLLNFIFTHQLNQDQRDLLLAFSVYREAVPLAAAQTIVEARGGMTTEQLMAAQRVLLAQHLLQASREGRYQLHSLVAEFAQECFVENDTQANEQALRAAHAVAAQYYRQEAALNCPPRKQRRRSDDIHDLIEAIWHYCQARRQQEAYALILKEGVFPDLLRWGDNITLLELYLYVLPSETWHPESALAARIYNEIGDIYEVLGQQRQAEQYFEQALHSSRTINERSGMVMSLNNLGVIYRKQGRIDDALACYQEAKRIEDEIEDSSIDRGITHNNLGYIYYFLGQQAQRSARKERARKYYELALQHYEQAMPLHRAAGYRREEARTLNNIGKVYAALELGREAYAYYLWSLEMTQEIGDRRDAATVLNDLGVYFRESEPEVAEEYYWQARTIFHKIGASEDECLALQNLGYLHLFQKKYKLSLACFVLARDTFNDLKNSERGEIPRSVMIELRLALGEQELKALLEEIEQQAEEIVEQAQKGGV